MEKNKRPFLSGRSFPKQISRLLSYVFADILLRAAEDGSYHGLPFLEFGGNEHIPNLFSFCDTRSPKTMERVTLLLFTLSDLNKDGHFGNLRVLLRSQAAAAQPPFITLGHPWSCFCSLPLQDIASLGA